MFTLGLTQKEKDIWFTQNLLTSPTFDSGESKYFCGTTLIM